MTDGNEKPPELGEAIAWEVSMRRMLSDLKASLSNRWCRWDDWERKFIQNITRDIETKRLDFTLKQQEKIFTLWERTHK